MSENQVEALRRNGYTSLRKISEQIPADILRGRRIGARFRDLRPLSIDQVECQLELEGLAWSAVSKRRAQSAVLTLSRDVLLIFMLGTCM